MSSSVIDVIILQLVSNHFKDINTENLIDASNYSSASRFYGVFLIVDIVGFTNYLSKIDLAVKENVKKLENAKNEYYNKKKKKSSTTDFNRSNNIKALKELENTLNEDLNHSNNMKTLINLENILNEDLNHSNNSKSFKTLLKKYLNRSNNIKSLIELENSLNEDLNHSNNSKSPIALENSLNEDLNHSNIKALKELQNEYLNLSNNFKALIELENTRNQNLNHSKNIKSLLNEYLYHSNIINTRKTRKALKELKNKLNEDLNLSNNIKALINEDLNHFNIIQALLNEYKYHSNIINSLIALKELENKLNGDLYRSNKIKSPIALENSLNEDLYYSNIIQELLNEYLNRSNKINSCISGKSDKALEKIEMNLLEELSLSNNINVIKDLEIILNKDLYQSNIIIELKELEIKLHEELEIIKIKMIENIKNYFEKLIKIVLQYDGQVVMFTGDGLQIIWHIPFNLKKVNENYLPRQKQRDYFDKKKEAIQMAIACACEITESLWDFDVSINDVDKSYFCIRSGIGFGEMLLVNIFSKEISIIEEALKTRKAEFFLLGEPVKDGNNAEALFKIKNLQEGVVCNKNVKAYLSTEFKNLFDIEDIDGSTEYIHIKYKSENNLNKNEKMFTNICSQIKPQNFGSNKKDIEAYSNARLIKYLCEQYVPKYNFGSKPLFKGKLITLFIKLSLNGINLKHSMGNDDLRTYDEYGFINNLQKEERFCDQTLLKQYQNCFNIICQNVLTLKGYLRQFVNDDKGVIAIAIFDPKEIEANTAYLLSRQTSNNSTMSNEINPMNGISIFQPDDNTLTAVLRSFNSLALQDNESATSNSSYQTQRIDEQPQFHYEYKIKNPKTDINNSAFECAISIRNSLRDTGVFSSIGMASGICWFGHLGNRARNDFVIIGDGVIKSARLMSIAVEGEILIDDSCKFNFQKSSLKSRGWKLSSPKNIKLKGYDFEEKIYSLDEI